MVYYAKCHLRQALENSSRLSLNAARNSSSAFSFVSSPGTCSTASRPSTNIVRRSTALLVLEIQTITQSFQQAVPHILTAGQGWLARTALNSLRNSQLGEHPHTVLYLPNPVRNIFVPDPHHRSLEQVHEHPQPMLVHGTV